MITLIMQGLEAAGRSLGAIGIGMIVAASWDLGAALLVTRHPLPPEVLREWRQEAQELTERFGRPTPGGADAARTAGAGETAPRVDEAGKIGRHLAALLRWFSDARSIAVPLTLLGVLGWGWSTAGRLGYLEAQLIGNGSLRTFFTTGVSRLASTVEVAGLRLALGVVGIAASAALLLLGQVGGTAWRTAWGVVADLGLVGVMAIAGWFSIVSVFWIIAAVVDRLGPIAALQASMAAVRGRFWRVCGLLLAWALVGLAVMVLVASARGVVVMAVGPQAGRIVEASLGMCVVVFTRFALDASLIACYRERRGPVAGAGQPGGSGG